MDTVLIQGVHDTTTSQRHFDIFLRRMSTDVIRRWGSVGMLALIRWFLLLYSKYIDLHESIHSSVSVENCSPNYHEHRDDLEVDLMFDLLCLDWVVSFFQSSHFETDHHYQNHPHLLTLLLYPLILRLFVSVYVPTTPDPVCPLSENYSHI